MANKRIPDLTPAGSFALSNLLEISDGTATSKSVTGTQIQAAITSGFVPTSRTIATTGPLAGGGDLSADRTFSIADAVADGATKGAAAFLASDFNSAAGVISIDYTNGQAANAGTKGFLTAADWNTFNAKQSALPVADNAPLIKGSVDATKLFRFEVDGFTAGVTRVATPPDANITLAGINIANAWADGVTQTFNPNGTSSGLNVGAHTADPSALNDGDVWYESTANELHARINGATVALGAGGGASPPFVDTTAIVKGSVDATKLLRFEVDGFTAGATRVATPPDQDFVIAGTNVAQTFSVVQTISPAVNTSALIVSGFSLTGASAQSLIDLSGTWNTSGAATGIKLNVTDTASNVNSKLLDLQSGGVSKFAIGRLGDIAVGSVFGVNGTTGLTAISPSANTTALSVTGFSLTGANTQSMISLAGTWNTSGLPTGIKLNITDTASNASSLLMDLQVGGASRASVSKAGAATFAGLMTSAGVSSSAGITLASVFAVGTNGNVNIVPAANTSAITVTGFSLTGANANALIDLSGTWNTSGIPTAFKLNITDTASNSDSILMDLQIGGVSKFLISKDGSFICASGAFSVASNGSFSASGGPFAVDVSSNLTVNNGITFNANGITLSDAGGVFVLSGNIDIPDTITFSAGAITITSDSTRLVFSSNIQIGTVTLDDASGALETNTFKAITALQVGGGQISDSGGVALQFSTGYTLRLGIAFTLGAPGVPSYFFSVFDSAGDEYYIPCVQA